MNLKVFLNLANVSKHKETSLLTGDLIRNIAVVLLIKIFQGKKKRSFREDSKQFLKPTFFEVYNKLANYLKEFILKFTRCPKRLSVHS